MYQSIMDSLSYKSEKLIWWTIRRWEWEGGSSVWKYGDVP